VPDIRKTYTLPAEPDRVFAALTEAVHVSKWWTPDCESEPVEGTTTILRFAPTGDSLVMVVDEIVPGERIRWSCIDSVVAGTHEWSGTAVRFELGSDGSGRTRVDLHHEGFRGDTPVFRRSSEDWDRVVGGRLKTYLESGRSAKPE
jgi:uncharacterized protein YndB with AHSA1/START domain